MIVTWHATSQAAAIDITLDGKAGGRTSSSESFPALNLDDLMPAIIHAWQEATDNRLAEHATKLTAVFEKHDGNHNDMLDYSASRGARPPPSPVYPQPCPDPSPLAAGRQASSRR